MIPWLPPEAGLHIPFPAVETALTEPNGLLCAGGDLSPERLIAAYRRGIFPWFGEGDPILWWSPNPRTVLFPGEFILHRSLAKTLRNARYEVRCDTAFGAVLEACASTPRAGQHGTWITQPMRAAYLRLFDMGYAHSVETWIDGRLAGGLYGVAVGHAFFGESMFAHARDASKIALAHLSAFVRERDFGIIDCQMETAHLTSLGARPIARMQFVGLLAALRDAGDPPARWPADAMRGLFGRNAT